MDKEDIINIFELWHVFPFWISQIMNLSVKFYKYLYHNEKSFYSILFLNSIIFLIDVSSNPKGSSNLRSISLACS